MSQIHYQYFTGKFEGENKNILFYQSWRPNYCEKICVMVHGLGEHSGRYGDLVDVLTKNGFGVYTYDHRGHGRSRGQRGYVRSFDQLINDLRAFLKLVSIHEDKKPIFLFGHSLGGLIALRYLLACERKNSMVPTGVVLSNPTLGISVTVPLWKEKLSLFLSKFFPRLTLHNEIDLLNLSHDRKIIEDLKNDKLCHQRISARFYRGILSSIEYVFKDIEKLYIPIFLLVGGKDRIANPDKAASLYLKINTRKQFKVYPEFFHELVHEIGKEEVFEDILSWFLSFL